jgi:hypothetical protein
LSELNRDKLIVRIDEKRLALVRQTLASLKEKRLTSRRKSAPIESNLHATDQIIWVLNQFFANRPTKVSDFAHYLPDAVTSKLSYWLRRASTYGQLTLVGTKNLLLTERACIATDSAIARVYENLSTVRRGEWGPKGILCDPNPMFVMSAQVALSIGQVLVCGFAIPLHRFQTIFRYSLPIVVANAQIVLGNCKILIGGLAKPDCCFLLVFRYPLAIAVTDSQIVLSNWQVLTGGSEILFHRFHRILFHTLTIGEAGAHLILSRSEVLFSSFTEPLHRLRNIFGSTPQTKFVNSAQNRFRICFSVFSLHLDALD